MVYGTRTKPSIILAICFAQYKRTNGQNSGKKYRSLCRNVLPLLVGDIPFGVGILDAAVPACASLSGRFCRKSCDAGGCSPASRIGCGWSWCVSCLVGGITNASTLGCVACCPICLLRLYGTPLGYSTVTHGPDWSSDWSVVPRTYVHRCCNRHNEESSILEQILNPLYARHPSLKPPEWEE